MQAPSRIVSEVGQWCCKQQRERCVLGAGRCFYGMGRPLRKVSALVDSYVRFPRGYVSIQS